MDIKFTRGVGELLRKFRRSMHLLDLSSTWITAENSTREHDTEVDPRTQNWINVKLSKFGT